MASWTAMARRGRVPLGFVLAALYLWLARPAWSSIVLGGAVALAGLALRAAASGHITKNSALTTTGPYAYTRNPLYLGSVLLAAGFALAARSWWIALALVLMFALIYLPVVRGEEAYLRSRFPEFDDYMRRVPRFLPRLGLKARQTEAGKLFPETVPGAFSRQLYLRHREYNALLGTAAMLAALIAKLLWLGRR